MFKSAAALAEDPGLVPSTPMAAHNPFITSVPEGLIPLLASVNTRHTHGAQAYV